MDIRVPETTLGITLSPELIQDIVNWAVAGSPPPALDFIKKMTLLQYAAVFSSASFIETGTFRGTTTRLMADVGLQCKSIELSEELYQAAVRDLADHPKVELFFGDSSVHLGKMVARATAPHLFWLDGHYSQGSTAHGETETPIVQELQQLLNLDIRNSVVLIDDIRDFGTGDYPSLSYLEDFVTTNMPHHVYENYGDIFRITPRVTLAGQLALLRTPAAA